MNGCGRAAKTESADSYNWQSFFEGDPIACKKIGSNQHRLSSHGTLQPLLGDCDLAVGYGSLSDI